MENLVTENQNALINETLSLEAFHQLAGKMSGNLYVKVVLDTSGDKPQIHFINDHKYKFHADYIAENILNKTIEEVRGNIDEYNKEFYFADNRKLYLGILSLHQSKKYNHKLQDFFILETVEVDNMSGEKITFFYDRLREKISSNRPLLFKPANHIQESSVGLIDSKLLPRIYNHELLQDKTYIALNEGKAKGRLRIFLSYDEYKRMRDQLEWYDIIAMDRVPDNIPRLSGIINSEHTTPLSHTNVLAHGWEIPNCVDVGIVKNLLADGLDGSWVEFEVKGSDSKAIITPIATPEEKPEEPKWKSTRVILEKPHIESHPILNLKNIRMSDHDIYGTKSANIGELHHLIQKGSKRLLGFYSVPRPPRSHLLGYLQNLMGETSLDNLNEKSLKFISDNVIVPKGIAIPFSFQQKFLEKLPHVQQQIGRLKMALEMDLKEIGPICLKLQRMIKKAPMCKEMMEEIDGMITTHLAGSKNLVVRSSSNAEDLQHFSAAGIYESKNKVMTAHHVFRAIKSVWASLVSPRSVKLRQDVGISLDDTYMGVTIQEQVESTMGGVLITTNPANKDDFRNVYINASDKSAVEIVDGKELPYQYLYNTLEGGGRTLSIGNHEADLDKDKKDVLQKLAIIGRLLQSHFSPDYTFETPMDIEWASDGKKIYLLQIRPYGG